MSTTPRSLRSVKRSSTAGLTRAVAWLGAAGLCGAALGAINDIPAGETYLIQGSQANGHLNVQTAGFQNAGALRLESINAGYLSAFTVTNGIFTNLVSGAVNVNQGSGGGRGIYGDVRNYGTLNANWDLDLTAAGKLFQNYGAINIVSGRTVSMNGAGQVFEQRAGTIANDGGLRFNGPKVDYQGGQFTGNAPYLINCDLVIGPQATNGVTFMQTGSSSTYAGDTWPGQTIWVRGDGTGRHTTLTAPNGFSNAGRWLLESQNAGWTSALTVSAGQLRNLAGGVIDIGVGSGGPRQISADLLNLGALNVGYGLTLSKANGVYDNQGAINIAEGQTLSISGQNQVFNQQAGTLTIAGGFTANGITFNFLGGDIAGTLT
jgi:hypothetical protein